VGIAEVIVLDTHVWLWWLSNPEKLSKGAAKRIERETSDGRICISSISVWETAMLVAKGRLELSIDLNDWLAISESLPFVEFIPVSNRIALQSVHLQELHNDPADRIIIATAIELSASVVSADNKIIAYPFVKTIW
jgi:PIN domain nuclease of toxin-antitoxin system